MGNEISHEKATTDNVGGRGHVGHFHKVLVEPDYAALDLPYRSQPVAQADPDYDTPDLAHDNESPTDQPHSTQNVSNSGSTSKARERQINDTGASNRETGSIIEECKALITESANKALARNLSDSHIYKKNDPNTSGTSDTVRNRTRSENSKQVQSCECDIKAAGNSIKLGKNKKCSHQSDIKPVGVRKPWRGRNTIISMFKFSKKKPKIVAEFVPQTGDIQEIDNTEDRIRDTTNSAGSAYSNGEMENIQGNRDTLEFDSDHHGKTPDVERLDSLDSGIVVEKSANEPQTIVAEYAIVQKKARSTKLEYGGKCEDVPNINSSASEVMQNMSAGISESVSSKDEDYSNINECAIDVEGLIDEKGIPLSQSTNNESQISNNTSIVNTTINENNNYTSKAGFDDDGKIAVVETGVRPENKIKKKSWSFQIGGNRKKSNEFNPSGSVDGDYVNVERKKHKSSLWGKFSFRKSSDDVSSVSKHGSFDAIPETVKSQVKTKLKLRNIKAKKEKKLKKKERIDEAPENTSLSSHSCFASTSDMNTPGSRRSIVDEDFSYTQSDAFEGVSLSDLSLEGDEPVSNNPAGSKEQAQQKTSQSEEMKQENQNKPVETAKTRVDYVNTEVHEYPTQNEDRTIDIGSNKDITTKIDTKPDRKIQNGEYRNRPNVDIVTTEEVSHLVDLNEHSSTTVVDSQVVTDEYAIVVKNVKDNTETNITGDKVNMTGDELDKEMELNSGLKETISKTEHVPKVVDAEIKAQKVAHVEATLVIDPASQQSLTSRRIGEKLASSHEMAYSNLIYGEYPLATQDDNEVSDDESDAYVQLEQLVEDYKRCEEDSSRLKNISMTSTVSAENKNTSPDFTSLNLPTRKPRVILMKEVGIQAPDIHMPLDIDADFGTRPSNCGYVNRGTQVSETDLTSDISQKSPTAVVHPAYF